MSTNFQYQFPSLLLFCMLLKIDHTPVSCACLSVCVCHILPKVLTVSLVVSLVTHGVSVVVSALCDLWSYISVAILSFLCLHPAARRKTNESVRRLGIRFYSPSSLGSHSPPFFPSVDSSLFIFYLFYLLSFLPLFLCALRFPSLLSHNQ